MSSGRASIPEHQLRRSLISKLLEEHRHDDVVIVEEFGVASGASRIDVALLNGHIHGFEIKSDYDRLDRMEHQLQKFSAVCQKLTFVVGRRYVSSVLRATPHWCGVIVAYRHSTGVRFVTLRRSKLNPADDPEALARLLWRAEANALLVSIGVLPSQNRRRAEVWAKVVATLSVMEVRRAVVRALKQRAIARLAPLQMSCGD